MRNFPVFSILCRWLVHTTLTCQLATRICMVRLAYSRPLDRLLAHPFSDFYPECVQQRHISQRGGCTEHERTTTRNTEQRRRAGDRQTLLSDRSVFYWTLYWCRRYPTNQELEVMTGVQPRLPYPIRFRRPIGRNERLPYSHKKAQHTLNISILTDLDGKFLWCSPTAHPGR